MKLPVLAGVVDALEKHSARRKRKLELAKTTPEKKRRIALKKKRVKDRIEVVRETRPQYVLWW